VIWPSCFAVSLRRVSSIEYLLARLVDCVERHIVSLIFWTGTASSMVWRKVGGIDFQKVDLSLVVISDRDFIMLGANQQGSTR
jgi:hypothetical protein